MADDDLINEADKPKDPKRHLQDGYLALDSDLLKLQKRLVLPEGSAWVMPTDYQTMNFFAFHTIYIITPRLLVELNTKNLLSQM